MPKQNRKRKYPINTAESETDAPKVKFRPYDEAEDENLSEILLVVLQIS